MFKWLASLLVNAFGGGLAGELRGALADWRDAETDQKRIEAQERAEFLKGAIALSETQAGVIKAGMQTRVFWVVWSMFALPLALWWAAVILDSLFLYSGRIPDLPVSVRPWADQIFANVFWTGGGVAGASVLARAITARR